jgi:hypothetical protein
MSRCPATGKVSHASRANAESARRSLNDAGVGVYRCGRCHGWHVGHQRARAADRITQLLLISPKGRKPAPSTMATAIRPASPSVRGRFAARE